MRLRMSGFLVISRTDNWLAATPIFYGIVGLTRDAFPAERRELAEHIFAPNFPEEFEVFKAFNLDDLDAEDFNCFAQATKRAYHNFIEEHHSEDLTSQPYSPLLTHWGRLITQLEADCRYSRDNTGRAFER
jgi:hypothetical protein